MPTVIWEIFPARRRREEVTPILAGGADAENKGAAPLRKQSDLITVGGRVRYRPAAMTTLPTPRSPGAKPPAATVEDYINEETFADRTPEPQRWHRAASENVMIGGTSLQRCKI